jgi:hypothetical protein
VEQDFLVCPNAVKHGSTSKNNHYLLKKFAVIPDSQHAVTDSNMCLNILWLLCLLYLFSESRHENSQSGDIVGVTAPDFMQNVIVGQYFTYVLCKQA